jgi:molybdate transport system ATP-binding protein
VLEVDLTLQAGTFSLHAAFSAPTPGVTALFGRSGAGKSTLVNAIAGLLRPTSGSIRLDGRVLFDASAGVDLPAERRRIGCVFQDSRLFPHLDVSGNLEYGARRTRGAAVYAKRADVIELLGLGPLLSRRVSRLSGGERQRVALGRALLAQPALLLLDEPLAAVDGARRAEVLPYLESLRDRFAIPMLYASHQYDEVLRLAGHLVLLDSGRVLASGTPGALASTPEIRLLVGRDAAGAVLDAVVREMEPASGLVTVALGAETLRFVLPGAEPGARVRLYIPARDVMLATRPVAGLSVRNSLLGILTDLGDEGPDAVLATIAVGEASLQSWITRAAVVELQLRAGMPVWALVKAASLRGHAFAGRSPAAP